MQNKHGPTLCFYTEKESRKKGGGRDGERGGRRAFAGFF